MKNWPVWGIVLAVQIGCSQPPIVQPIDGTVKVQGTVTFDGQPIADGQISFVDTSMTPPREYIDVIRDGWYETSAPTGTLRVEIRISEASESTEGVASSGPFKQPVPARYNTDSQLKAEITSINPNLINFDLEK